MWIFLNDAFLSIVRHTGKPDTMMVRARVAGDIIRVFPGAKETETPDADYRFRAEILAKAVSEALAAKVMDIDYPNFKSSVDEHHRHDAYLKVWRVMNDYQRQRGSAGKV